MHHPFEHDITALAYDLVEGAERDTLLEHLAGCDQCRAIYDSYRDEQVTVRDAIVRDARSGASEAKALEATLRMLGSLEAEKPKRGRLIRFPAWLIVAEVAAMLLVAVGLFFILKPDDEVAEDVIAVAEADRAPAVIESGVAYVQDDTGEWKEAEAVPVDEWVSTGPDKFALRFENGSLTELDPESVFRISFASAEGEPIVYMLRGNGVVNNFGISQDVQVQSGDASFYAMPGAKLAMICFGGEGELRSWSVPDSMRARVVSGDVVLANSAQPGQQLPLRAGEIVEWNPNDMRVLADDDTLVLDVQTLYMPAKGGGTTEEYDAVLRQIELLLPRFAEFEHRAGAEPDAAVWRKSRIEVQRLKADLSKAQNRQQVQLSVDDVNLTLTTDGETLTLTVVDATGTTTWEKKSVEALKAAVPQRVAELLDGIEIEVKDGKFSLAGAQAEAHSEGARTVRIFARSSNGSKSEDDKDR